MFEGDASTQAAIDEPRIVIIAKVASALLLTLMLNFMQRATTTLRMNHSYVLHSPHRAMASKQPLHVISQYIRAVHSHQAASHI